MHLWTVQQRLPEPSHEAQVMRTKKNIQQKNNKGENQKNRKSKQKKINLMRSQVLYRVAQGTGDDAFRKPSQCAL